MYLQLDTVLKIIILDRKLISIKGTDRLCKVVELSTQCCGQIL